MADTIKPKSHRSRVPSGAVTISDSKNPKGTESFERFAGTLGPEVIDIGKLYAKTGYFTYDPGFMATASCKSKITYIDGDKGILLYRGYPIEELAAHSDFVEVGNLLLYGGLPSKKQKNKKSIEQFVKEYTQLCIKYNIYVGADITDKYDSPKTSSYLDYKIKDG